MPSRRNRAYYRKQRIKHIKRTKNISEHCYGYDWYQVDGAYSKGKIHCSCPLCSAKTNNKRRHGYNHSKNWKPSDLKKIEDMDYQEHGFRTCEADVKESWDDIIVNDVSVDGVPLDGHYFDNAIDF